MLLMFRDAKSGEFCEPVCSVFFSKSVPILGQKGVVYADLVLCKFQAFLFAKNIDFYVGFCANFSEADSTFVLLFIHF